MRYGLWDEDEGNREGVCELLDILLLANGISVFFSVFNSSTNMTNTTICGTMIVRESVISGRSLVKLLPSIQDQPMVKLTSEAITLIKVKKALMKLHWNVAPLVWGYV